MSSHRQDWDDSVRAGELAVEAVKRFLVSDICRTRWKDIRLIQSVEDNCYYQQKGIDLRTIAKAHSSLELVTIEVKGDRNEKTGNFFLETVSDVAKGTQGAFLMCEANWYFYFFLNRLHLFCLPLEKVRAWFHGVTLQERNAASRRADRQWTTRGKLAPIARVMREIPGCLAFYEKEGEWCDLCCSQPF